MGENMIIEDVAEVTLVSDTTIKSLIEYSAGSLIHARDNAYPNEAVGYIRSDALLYPLINQARSPKRFIVSDVLAKEAIDEITRDGAEPAMVYHSHPVGDSTPSNNDRMMMSEMIGAVFVIVGKDDISAWCYKYEPVNGIEVDFPTLVFQMTSPEQGI